MTYASIHSRLGGAVLGLTMALGVGVSASAQTDSVSTLFRGGVMGTSGVSGGVVALPNGKYTEYTEDISVKVAGGYVRWTRDFNGNQWRFNPHWMSLNFEFDTIMIAASSSGGSSGGNAVAIAPQEPPEYFGGTVIPGADGGLAGGQGPLWAISRNGTWFTAESTYCSFSVTSNARYLLKPVFAGEAPACPTNRFSGQLAVSGGGGGSGAISPTPEGGIPSNLAGFRWEDRLGDWIEFDRTGRMSGYGDRNNIKVTMQYASGKLVGVLDHTGRKVLEIAYDGSRISEVRDVPRSGDAEPARVVKYTYASNGGLKTVTDVRGNVTTYEYDDRDRMKSVTDQEGRIRQISYGPTNRVAKLTQADGAVTEYEYDYDATKKQFYAKVKRPVVDGQQRVEVSIYSSDGQMIAQEVNGRTQRELSQDGRSDKITDGRGNVTETSRNEFNQITSVRYADGATVSNTFSAKTLELEQQRDIDGFNHRYERDETGELRRQVMAVGTSDERTIEYTLDANRRVKTASFKGRTETDGRITLDATYAYEYDDQDNITQVTDAEGKVWTYSYNRLGDTATETDPRKGTWRYSYDAAGNLLSSTSPLGHVTRYEYDKTGNELKMIDGRGKVYRSQYDGRNRQTGVINPYGAVYKTDYNAIGAVSAVTDAAGRSTRFAYDAWVRPSQAWDGKGFTYAMDYTDADGKDTGARQPNKVKYPTFERRFKYNARNRPAEKTDLDGDDGRSEQYTYDSTGRQKTVTDANGKTSTQEYNAFGQLVRSADSMGNGLRFAYDARGNISEITDANGKKTRFEYDRRGLLLSETDALGKTTRYGHDENGWPTSTTFPSGTKATFEQDADGRLTLQKEYDAAGTLVKTIQYEYDEEDNLRKWSDGRYSATLEYDDADRLSQETIDYGVFKRSRAYTYYPNNQVKTYTGPDGVSITYSYDAVGQLERVTIPGEGDISVTDWQWAARKTVLLPGGTEQRLSHDGLLMTTGMKVVNPGQATVFELEEKYGRAFEVEENKRDGVTTRYGYDGGYRLTGVQAASADFNEGYTVDAAGNRVTHQRGGTAVGGTWTYDDAQQLKQRGNISYEYDDNGNLIRKIDSSLAEPMRTTRYVYDPMNRLSEVSDGSGAIIARYTYDPFDRRLSKQIGASGEMTYFFPSSLGLLGEMNATGDVTVTYGWHPEQEDGAYPLFARVPALGGDFRYVYFHNDHLGTPQRITDKSGAIVWAADYDGFGKATIRSSATNPVTNNLRYPGQYFDVETGLHYNDRRYYDPQVGRYITRDPIGFEGGGNLYAYAAHNPANFIDPTGEIIPCLVANYLRCMASCMLMSTVEDLILECGNINWGDNLKDCAVDCLLSMLPIPNPCGKFGKWISAGLGVLSSVNSFPAETLVHVRPPQADTASAALGRSILKPIGQLQPGDQVLALAEWKDRGISQGRDQRLSYERVTDVFTSFREQNLIHVTFTNGRSLTATEGHPFKTANGWVDAIRLAPGTVVIGKFSEGADRDEGLTIAEIKSEKVSLQVFNLEVANAHTFFVGEEGALVHNGGRSGKQPRLKEMGGDDKLPSHVRGWIKQERNLIACKKRKTIRVPPGYEMAHRRGFPAKNGHSYKNSDLQNPDLHDLQHKWEGY
ncbi:intein C-terminal splicing region/intein N-terminal splicing region/RHS repeat-associated core domain-containing protein [Roseateles sp. YR242]|nr:intein C-terminal splicing region/intein N-terminal splicing region/RHS repeat-associated core domain-containing protein [Roseateles sp. YR242]